MGCCGKKTGDEDQGKDIEMKETSKWGKFTVRKMRFKTFLLDEFYKILLECCLNYTSV